ncbi:hypothetical protein ACWEO4_16010 [Streptomyces sp. NPDC004393]|uniref:hypothetical protein n=1 Tax=unclassified Streptomyces TaxID=2593676 RepID=UPI0033A06702
MNIFFTVGDPPLHVCVPPGHGNGAAGTVSGFVTGPALRGAIDTHQESISKALAQAAARPLSHWYSHA